MMRTDRVLVIGALDNGRGQSKSFLKVCGDLLDMLMLCTPPEVCALLNALHTSKV